MKEEGGTLERILGLMLQFVAIQYCMLQFPRGSSSAAGHGPNTRVESQRDSPLVDRNYLADNAFVSSISGFSVILETCGKLELPDRRSLWKHLMLWSYH